MKLWKRLLSLVLAFGLVIGMEPIIPFVQANTETTTATVPAETVWGFNDGAHAGLTLQDGYTCEGGVITWQAGKSGTKTNTNGTEDTADDVEYDVYGLYHGNAIVFDNSANWTDYYVSMDVTSDCPDAINTNDFTTLKNYAQIAFKLGDSAIYTSAGVCPSNSANSATYNIDGTTTASGSGAWIVDGDGAALGEVKFNMTLLVRSGVAALYVDGHRAWTGEVANGQLAINTFGNGSAANTPSTVTYDNIRIWPAEENAYIPFYVNKGNVSISAETAWHYDMNSDGTALTDAVSTVWLDQGYAVEDGWIKADFTLPAKPSNLSSSGTQKWYGLYARSTDKPANSSQNAYIESALWVNKNATVLNFRTLLRYSSYNTGGAQMVAGDVSVNSYNLWGKTVSMSMRIVGNYIEVHYVCEEANFDKLVQTALPTSAKIGSKFRFGIHHAGDAGATARITNIEVGKYDQLATLTVDASAAELVTLPEYADPKSVVSARDAYYVGETVALTVADGYDVFANGEKIEDPANFVIPEAGTVTITAKNIPIYTVTVPTGITVDKETAREGETVTLTLDETVVDAANLKVNGGAVAVTGSNGTYTFIMPGEPVTVTCDALKANEELYNSDGKSGYAAADGWNQDGTFTNGAAYIFDTQMTDGWATVSFTMPAAKKSSYSSNPSYNIFAKLYDENGAEAGKIEVSLILNRNGTAYNYTSFRLGFRDTEYGSGINTRKDITIYNGANRDLIWGKTITLSLRKVGNYVEAKLTCATNPELNKALGVVTSDSMANTAFKFQVQQITQMGTVSAISLGRINKTVAVTSASDHVTLPADYKLETNMPNTGYAQRNAYQVGETVSVSVDSGYALYANDVLVADPLHYQIPNVAAVALSAQKVNYNDVTVTPAAGIAVAPATNVEEGAEVTITVDPEILKVSTLAVTGENTNYTIENGGLIAGETPNTYTFVMPGEPVTVTCDGLVVNEVVETAGSSTLTNWTATQTFADGWVEVQIDLPQISNEDWQASVDAMTAAWNATQTNPGSNVERRVELLNGSNYIRAAITIHRNVKNITFQLEMPKNLIGASKDLKKTVQTGAYNYIVYEGQTVTVKLRKIGNFVETLIVDADGQVLENWAFTIAEGAAFHSVTEWTAKLSAAKNGQFGKNWDETNGLTDMINTDAYFTGITVGKINKKVTLTSDEYVKLPVTKTPDGDQLSRTSYQVGEVVKLTVVKGYILYANDAVVVDPLFYEIPDADTVALVCQEDEDALANATADINDAFNTESLMVNRGWSREMQILMGSARVYGSADSYLNGIFGSERWSSYTASADITVYGMTSIYTGVAALCAKTDSVSGGYEFGVVVENGAQKGYVRLYDRTNGKILYADGSIKLDLGKAYNLKLVVTANTLTGYLDGCWLFSVNVEETVGGVGIRAQNANAAFDNIKVTNIEMAQ